MKCVRNIGFGFYSKWNKACRKYNKRFWKKTTPYSRRANSCAKALYYIRIKNFKMYRIEYTNILKRGINSPKKRWQ